MEEINKNEINNNMNNNQNRNILNDENMKRQQRGRSKGKRVEKKKGNKKKFKMMVLIILVLLVIGIILFKITDYIILDKNTTTNLVINNNNVTLNLKNEIIIKEDNIYLSKQDVANFFDQYIYEDPDTKQIITTHDKKIAELTFDENVMQVNDSDVKIYGTMFEENEIIYIPMADMVDVYNIEIQYIEETKVLTIDSLDRAQTKAIVTSDMAIKSSTGIISKTLDRVEKGDTVIVISSTENYTKVRTDNGKVGYVKTDKLENEFVVREAYEEEKQIEGKINLTWEYFSEYGSAPNMDGQTIEGINVVSPSFFYLDDDGELKENVGTSGKAYIDWAKENGYKVWPMVGNAEAGITVTSEVMNDYEKREKLILDLVEVAVKYQLDGLNIDFENMKEEDKDLYSRFIIELTPRLKEFGMVVSVDVTAPDGAPTWSLCFDRHVLGNVADYIIFMGYDQYGASSPNPGTTAGFDWVELSVDKFLGREEIEPEKLILAVPFYTRVWTTNSSGEIISNSTVSIENIDKVVPESTTRVWDEELKQYYAEYESGGNKKEIWIEDIESLKAKIELINEKELAGVASWVRGMETEEVWTMFKQELGL